MKVQELNCCTSLPSGVSEVQVFLSIEAITMVSACVTLKANTHYGNLRKDNTFRQDGGFLGDRIKGSLSYSPWIINQLALSLRTQERVKKAKPGVVSAVLTSSTTKESVVSSILVLDPFYTF